MRDRRNLDTESDTMKTDPLLSTAQASQYVGLARQTMARLRVEGAGPSYYKLGSKVAYRQSTLDAWLTARARRSTSDAPSDCVTPILGSEPGDNS